MPFLVLAPLLRLLWVLPLALLVMKFIVSVYVIPTGAMQPTIHGTHDYPGEGGDRIIVNKFIYRLSKPQRWDVMVFEYPYHILHCNTCSLDLNKLYDKKLNKVPDDIKCGICGNGKGLKFKTKDYIFRCVGLPDEELTVVDGNILLRKNGTWTHARKTDAAQEALWVEECALSESADDFFALWAAEGPIAWQNMQLRLRGDATLQYKLARKIRGWGDAGGREKDSGYLPGIVGDIRISLELQHMPTSGRLELSITRNGNPQILRLDFAAREAFLFDRPDGEPLARIRLNQAPGRVSLARADGQLLAGINGVVHARDIPGEDPLVKTESILPGLRFWGEQLSLADLRLERDVYYDETSSVLDRTADRTCKIKTGEYFVMGDNSYHCADSRHWGPVPEGDLHGKAWAVMLPPDRKGLVH